jgi:hypothetical protein
MSKKYYPLLAQQSVWGVVLCPAPCRSDSLPPGSVPGLGRGSSAQQVHFYFIFFFPCEQIFAAQRNLNFTKIKI